MNLDVRHHPLVFLFQKKMGEENYVHNLRDLRNGVSFLTHFSNIEFDAEYFEWIALLEAVSQAKKRFVMFELGAGYGRWCIHATLALKFLNPIPFHFVAVEPETNHFKFLKECFLVHGLNLNEHRLVKAAVDSTPGFALFHMGDSEDWYGQCIDQSKEGILKTIRHIISQIFLKSGMTVKRRKALVRVRSLNSLLNKYEQVDLIDMDIQGAELNVIKGSLNAINKKVKCLHISTHSKEIDEGLKIVLKNQGWQNLHSYSCLGESITPYGVINFVDGMQTWVNPRIP